MIAAPSKAEVFRARARELRDIAKHIPDAELRAEALKIADEWDELAGMRDRMERPIKH